LIFSFHERFVWLVEYPKLGRCSMEIIKELDKIVADLLQVFANTCGNLPNKIVFYRDGVDDGQYQKVLDNEVTKIKAAFRSTYFISEIISRNIFFSSFQLFMSISHSRN
jgi:hypothetical protein